MAAMGRKTNPRGTAKQVGIVRHKEAKRLNIPTGEQVRLAEDVVRTIHLLSENGLTTPGHVLAFYPNGTYIEWRFDKLGTSISTYDGFKEVGKSIWAGGSIVSASGLILTASDSTEMTVFCAAESHKATVFQSVMLKNVRAIKLQTLENGGSMICANGTGYIPDFNGRLNPILDSSKRIYLYADNIAINGGKGQPVHFRIGEPLILEDNKGAMIRLTVKGMIARSSILEYERLPSGFARPNPSPSTAFADTPESVVSYADYWEPLPIDRKNPLHRETVKALEDVIQTLKADNGYAATKPEERAEVLEALESGTKKLENENAVLKGTVRRMFNALKRAGKTFYETTIAGGKIAYAWEKLTQLAKELWDWLFS